MISIMIFDHLYLVDSFYWQNQILQLLIALWNKGSDP